MTDRMPERLPATFTSRQAAEQGITVRQLHSLLVNGAVERLSRGLYRRADAELADIDMIEIATRVPEATLCLETALAKHGLSDLIPSRPDVAVYHGRRFPAVRISVAWHEFRKETFEIGRETMRVDSDLSIGIYSAERSIVDMVRLRHLQGPEVAYEAIRRYFSEPGARSRPLLAVAARFPQAEPELRRILAVIRG